MTDWIPSLILAAYVLVSLLLLVYGLNCYFLAYAGSRMRNRTDPAPVLENLPCVTVQLPIYNEKYVLHRLLDAAVSLDWPRDRLEIQILDDSDDETRQIASELAAEWRSHGVHVSHVTRPSRAGFKAGALREGLALARGGFLAIFDADFIPRSDFLKRTIPHFADLQVACVQTRWSHVNEDYSWVTRALAVGIDGHFAVEQRVRCGRGFFLNFNGTAGVWRREAIVDAGNWSGDTIAEDLDLSYRAQLRGWRIQYLPEVDSPAEIPVQVHAFRRQQFRWAKGSIQCAKKHLPRILTRRDLPFSTRVEATLHLTNYAIHPLMLALFLVLIPLILTTHIPLELTILFATASLGPFALYSLGQRLLHPADWRRRVLRILPLTLLGVGISLSNTRAVLEGMTMKGGEFRRTPKFRVEQPGDSWREKPYALNGGVVVLGEGLLALLALATLVIAYLRGNFLAIPWVALFAASYSTMFALSVLHTPVLSGREVSGDEASPS